MLITISKKCDILYYYPGWLMQRFQEGFVDVEVKRKVFERCPLNSKDIEGILFWTHNPRHFLPYLDEFMGLGYQNYMFIVNYNLYDHLIEPKNQHTPAFTAIKELVKTTGKDKVLLRYAPLIFNDFYTLEQHEMFMRIIIQTLSGKIKHFMVPTSANMALKKNLRIKAYDPGQDVISSLHKCAARLCVDNGVEFHTCLEGDVQDRECFCTKFMTENAKAAGYAVSKQDIRLCNEIIDIGHYAPCTRGCAYCRDKSPRRPHVHGIGDTALNYFPTSAKAPKPMKSEPFFRHQIALSDIQDDN